MGLDDWNRPTLRTSVLMFSFALVVSFSYGILQVLRLRFSTVLLGTMAETPLVVIGATPVDLGMFVAFPITPFLLFTYLSLHSRFDQGIVVRHTAISLFVGGAVGNFLGSALAILLLYLGNAVEGNPALQLLGGGIFRYVALGIETLIIGFGALGLRNLLESVPE